MVESEGKTGGSWLVSLLISWSLSFLLSSLPGAAEAKGELSLGGLVLLLLLLVEEDFSSRIASVCLASVCLPPVILVSIFFLPFLLSFNKAVCSVPNCVCILASVAVRDTSVKRLLWIRWVRHVPFHRTRERRRVRVVSE